jgi:hypothetical protein
MQQYRPQPMPLPGKNWQPSIVGMRLNIVFPSSGKLRARRVVSRSNARGTGKYPAIKTGRMMQYESLNERNAMQLLDACPAVASFYEQPCTIGYGRSDDMRMHYPDLLVLTNHHGKEFWEIKEAHEAYKPEVIYRTSVLSRLLPRYGYRYRLVIAESLKAGPQLENAKLLMKLGRNPVSPLQRERIRKLFQQFESLPWMALIQDEDGLDLRPQICRLILEGALTFDGTKPLTDTTHIRWVFNQKMEGEQSWHSLDSFKAL